MNRVSDVTLAALSSHESFVRAVARSLVSDPNEADDLRQETWLALLRRNREQGAVSRVWIAGVLRRVAFSRRRAERRRAHREREVSGSSSDAARALSTQQRVVAAVLALDEPYRETVLLYFYRGETPGEIANRLGLSVEGVRTRLKRALAKLRDALDEDFGDRETWALAVAPLLQRAASHLPLVAVAVGLGVLVLVGARALTGEASGSETRVASPALLAPVGGDQPRPESENEPQVTAARGVEPQAAGRSAVASTAASSTASNRAETVDPERSTDVAPAVLPDAEPDSYWDAVARARSSAVRFDAAEHVPPGDARVTAAVAAYRLLGFHAHAPSLGAVVDAIAAATGFLFEVDASLQERAAIGGSPFHFVFDRPLALTDLLDLLVSETGRDVVWYARDGRVRVAEVEQADWHLVAFSHSIADFLVDPDDYFRAGVDYHPIFAPPARGTLAMVLQPSVLCDNPDPDGFVFAEHAIDVVDTVRVHDRLQELLDMLRHFFVPDPESGVPGGSHLRHPGDADAELFARTGATPFAPTGPVEEVEGLAEHLRHVLDANVYVSRALARELETRFLPGDLPEGSVAEVLDALEESRPEMSWHVERGILRLSTCGDFGSDVLAIHDVRRALAPPGLRAEDLRETLPELARSIAPGEVLEEAHLMELVIAVDPASWDQNPDHRAMIDEGVLFVDQHPRAQQRIAECIRELARLAGGGSDD